MIEIVALVIDVKPPNHNYVQTIEFDMDGGKPFCYRSRVSYEAFSNVVKKRYRNNKDKLWYSCKHKVEHDINVKVWQGTMSRHPEVDDIYNIPNVKLKSLWDFYDYIRYDYKSKKFY